jgi:hypothetical protein
MAHQHGAKRSAALGHVGSGKVDGALQVLLIVGHGRPLGRMEGEVWAAAEVF